MKPDENSKDNFSDAGDTYYTGYLSAAKRLVLSGGIGDNKFAPEKLTPADTADRAQTAQILYKLLSE